MAGIQRDTERTLLREVDHSLKEWGRWSSDSMHANLGYPTEATFAQVRGRNVDTVDMRRVEEIENAYTAWKMFILQNTTGAVRRHRLLLLFILKLHYCEENTVADKVHHTSRAFHRPLSRSMYYVLLREARLKLAMLVY